MFALYMLSSLFPRTLALQGQTGQAPIEVHQLRYHCFHSNNYLRYFPGHTAQVNSLCMSPKNDLFLSAAQVWGEWHALGSQAE